MFLGVDIGSSSSKAALINDKKELVADAVVNKGTGTDGIDLALKQVYDKAGITHDDINRDHLSCQGGCIPGKRRPYDH